MSGVVFPISYKVDSSGLKEAESQFKRFGEVVKSAFEFAGIGLGVVEVIDFLKESAVKAVENEKSFAILSNTLKNVTGATEEQTKAVDAQIKSMGLATGHITSDLRPAYDTLVRSTKDTSSALYLLKVAQDASAGSGKDLSVVSIAMARAAAGNTASLNKLFPATKGAKDQFDALAQAYDGAAVAAANTDPIQKLNVVMQDLQEQIGTYLLPALEGFAGFLSDASTQGAIEGLVTEFGNWATYMTNVGTGLGVLTDDVNNFFAAMDNNVKSTPFTDLLETLATRLQRAINPLQFITDKLAFLGAQSKAAAKPDKTNKSTDFAKQMADWNAQQKKLQDEAKKTADALAKHKLALEAAKKAAADHAAAIKKAAAEHAAALKAQAKEQAQAIADLAAANKKALEDTNKIFTDLNQANVDFQKSFKGSITSIRNLANTAPSMGQFESQVTSAFDSIASSAQQAFDNKLITQTALDGLTTYAAKEQEILQGIGRQRDELANKINLAQALYSSTKDAIVGFGNIASILKGQTKTVQETTTEIINGISTTITKSVEIAAQTDLVAEYKKIIDKTKAFATNLKALKAAGLDNNLFQQIVSAGVDAGGATAEAIIAGGGSTITELNSLFSDLQDTGSQIAETTTVMMYNNGQDVVGGFIAGLQSQDSLLKDSAISMANIFANTFTSMLNSAIQASIQAAQDAVTKAALGLGGGNPALAAYAQASIQGLSGQALSDQIDMLTGANVTAPGSFMNTLGYMSASAPAPAAPPMVVVNVGGKEIVSAIKTYERANGSVWVAA